MRTFAWLTFLLLEASTEGFIVPPAVAEARCRSTRYTKHTEGNSAESSESTAMAAPLRRSIAAGSTSTSRGERSPGSWALRAKATYKNFEDMLEKEPGAILVDFYATWCGPCKMMAENLAVVGPTMKDELKIFKIDTDKYPKLMDKFGVTGLPTLVLFKGGKELQRVEGFLPADTLVQQLRYFLAGAAAAETSGGGSGRQGGDACASPPPPASSQDACAPPPRDACAPPPRE